VRQERRRGGERLALRATADVPRRGPPRSRLTHGQELDGALQPLAGRQTEQDGAIEAHDAEIVSGAPVAVPALPRADHPLGMMSRAGADACMRA